MNSNEKSNPRRLKPLKRLRRLSKNEIAWTARHFERRAHGAVLAEQLAKEYKLGHPDRKDNRWKDLESVKEALHICSALLESGKLTQEEYFFHSLIPVERLHDHRWTSGQYDEYLGPLKAAMDQIEDQHGLRPGEYWPSGKGPADYERLNLRYDKKLDDLLGRLFAELRLRNHAKLWRKDRAEFDRLREAGRASVFEGEDTEGATHKLVELYESEAKKCSAAKAYYAACVMIGSAAEARMLLKCLQEPIHLSATLSQMPEARRFHKAGPKHWNLAQLVAVAKKAGWVSDLKTKNAVVHIGNLLQKLHDLRNLVHPGKHAAGQPHVSIGRDQYEDARSAYLALRYGLESHSKGAAAS